MTAPRAYTAPGIDLCPKCKSNHITVRDSRSTAIGRRRHRSCDACGNSWLTLELPLERAKKMIVLRVLAENLVRDASKLLGLIPIIEGVEDE